ncbi:MAG TPA: sigma-54 dependent transcriptional regulator [Candidatus Methylacidiphilales bacterium]
MSKKPSEKPQEEKAAPSAPAAAPAAGPARQKLLVIDDEKDVHYSFKRLLESEGTDSVEVLSAESGDEGLKVLKAQPVDVVVMDIRMGNQNGLETLKQIRQITSKQVVIMMTAFGTSQTAIEAMKLGAYDYILKPFDIGQLKELLHRALEAARMMRTEVQLPLPAKLSPGEAQTIVGNAPAMQAVYKVIGQVAPTNTTVLITGESGTGKEMIARAIYQNSPRNNKLFIAINCTAIPENLLESELFGHERGSFTGAMNQRIGKFELGDGGTIFLDEIGDMPVTTQAKILRVLQEGEICRLGNNDPIKTDVRIIAATNKDLAEAVKKREFREDLFYRLNVVNLHLPKLAERRSDIPALVAYFLQKHRAKNPSGPLQVTPDALEALAAYDWPGNVRELENVIQRAMVFATGSSIQIAHLPEAIAGARAGAAKAEPSAEERLSPVVNDLLNVLRAFPSGEATLGDFERLLVRRALEEAGGEEKEAADLLGIAPADLKRLSQGPGQKGK